ncbi:MAG: ABC-2 transporter permease [Lachnospiraceae bacterium]|nr:ABC-2 transporter permease [Lachnospiraceae bacterium]
MKGLLKSNYYAVRSNVKVFSAVMVLLGIFVVAMDNEIPSLVIGYMLSVMIGFSINSIASAGRESTAKWSAYKLTTPVKRADIVKSIFLSQILWLFVGMVFAELIVTLSIALHGYPFDKDTDIFMLFVAGIGISLFMGAFFFPLFFWGGEERKEVFLIISLFCGIGVAMGLVTLVNTVFQSPMTSLQIILSGSVILACSILAFGLSYPLTVGIFRRKEY